MPTLINDAPIPQTELQKLPEESEAPAPPAVDMADLKRKSVRGGTVTLFSQAASIAINLASTVVLARLLSPDDYGVVAMVVAVTGFAALFRDLGLSSAAIQKKNLTNAQQSNLFWLNVAMGATITLVLELAAPAVAMFYGRPELRNVTAVLSLTFLATSIGTQHGAALVREMKFGRQAVANIAGAFFNLLVSVTLACQGKSYWSLVWGTLAGTILTTVLLCAFSPFKPTKPKRGIGTGKMMAFGANVAAFDFVNYFQRNLDNILIGRYWGVEPLGLYSKAYSILMLPIQAIRGPINAVAFPAMSQLLDSPEDYRAFYRSTTRVLAFLSMPISAFLFVAASPMIELMLGKEWMGAARIFSFLAVASFIQPVSSQRGLILLSVGDGRKYFIQGFIAALVTSVAFVIGLPFGPEGVAIGYAIAIWLLAYPLFVYSIKKTPIRRVDFFTAAADPAMISVAAAVVTLLVSNRLPEMNLVLRIGILFSTYTAAYLAPVAVLKRFAPERSKARNFSNRIQTRLFKKKAAAAH